MEYESGLWDTDREEGKDLDVGPRKADSGSRCIKIYIDSSKFMLFTSKLMVLCAGLFSLTCRMPRSLQHQIFKKNLNETL